MFNKRDQQIIDFIRDNGRSSSKDIFENLAISVSFATLRRALTKLISDKYIVSEGQGKGTKYFLSPSFEPIQPIDIDKYYENEIDERQIKETYNLNLPSEPTFKENELQHCAACDEE